MKIIFFSQNMKNYKGAFYQNDFAIALHKRHKVFFYGPGYKDFNIKDNILDVIKKSPWNEQGPDILFFGHSWLQETKKSFKTFNNFDLRNNKYPVFFFLNKEYACLSEKILFISKLNPQYIFSHNNSKNIFAKFDIQNKIKFIPFASNENIYKNSYKKYDLFFSGILVNKRFKDTYNFADRENIQNILFYTFKGLLLKKKFSKKIFWNPNSHNYFINFFNNYKLLSTEKYFKKLSESKIILNFISPSNLIGTRYFETMHSKSLIMSRYDSSLNFFLKDGHNSIIYKDYDEFRDKLFYYLNNEKMYNKVVKNSYLDAIRKHTWENRIDYMGKYLLL